MACKRGGALAAGNAADVILLLLGASLQHTRAWEGSKFCASRAKAVCARVLCK